MRSEMKAYIAVVIVQTSIAGMFLLIKASLSSGTKPCVFVVYRLAFAALFMTPFALWFKRESPPLTWHALCKIFIVSSYGLALSFNLNFAGLGYTSATFNSAMANLIPPLVFMMAVFLRIEKVGISAWHGKAKVGGSILGVCGAMAFTFYKGPPLYSIHKTSQYSFNKTTTSHSKQEWIKGSFLSIASQIFYSLWLTMQATLLKQYPGKARLLTLQCAFGALTAAIYGVAMERNLSSWKLGWNIRLLSAAYSGIGATGMCFLLQAWVIEKKGPVFSSIFGPLALIISAIFSAIFLKETLHWGSILGALLLVSGLYSFLWGKNREPQNGPLQKSDPSKEEAHLQTIVTSTPPIEQKPKEINKTCC